MIILEKDGAQKHLDPKSDLIELLKGQGWKPVVEGKDVVDGEDLLKPSKKKKVKRNDDNGS